MDNLKVQVKNEAESKEVQELLEFIGIRAGIKTLTRYIYANFTDREAYNHVMHPDKYKEITIQQLHDLVVLKRNDVGDATHLHIKYKKPKALITSDGLLYFYNFRTDKWDHESKCGDDFSIDNVKPIEKEMKMKEYLNPLKAGGYELSNDALCNDSIEVPEGAEIAIHFKKGDKYYFWKDGGLTNWHDKKLNSGEYEWLSCNDNLLLTASEFLKEWDDCSMVVWQRSETGNTAHDKKSERENDHYFIDVSDVDEVDFYEIAKRYNVTDPAVQHILKKCLAIGNRGYKDLETDLNDILKTAKRALEINGF